MPKILIVDENDNPIGSASKQEATEKNLVKRVVHLALITSENKILLQQRSTTRTTNPGFWTLSVTGHVDENEDYIAAAIRESKEELNLEITPFDLTFIEKYYIEFISSQGQKARSFSGLYVAKKDLDINRIIFNLEEVSKIKLVSFLELEELLKDNKGNFTFGAQDALNRLINHNFGLNGTKTANSK